MFKLPCLLAGCADTKHGHCLSVVAGHQSQSRCPGERKSAFPATTVYNKNFHFLPICGGTITTNQPSVCFCASTSKATATCSLQRLLCRFFYAGLARSRRLHGLKPCCSGLADWHASVRWAALFNYRHEAREGDHSRLFAALTTMQKFAFLA